jgi:hypothetical protein
MLEPVGSVSPKKNTGDDIKVIWANLGNNIGILCPAQAYPTPVFRYDNFLTVVTITILSLSLKNVFESRLLGLKLNFQNKSQYFR